MGCGIWSLLLDRDRLPIARCRNLALVGAEVLDVVFLEDVDDIGDVGLLLGAADYGILRCGSLDEALSRTILLETAVVGDFQEVAGEVDAVVNELCDAFGLDVPRKKEARAAEGHAADER